MSLARVPRPKCFYNLKDDLLLLQAMNNIDIFVPSFQRIAGFNVGARWRRTRRTVNPGVSIMTSNDPVSFMLHDMRRVDNAVHSGSFREAKARL